MDMPCKDCIKRSIYCHADCEKYIEAKAKNEEIRMKIYREKEIEGGLREVRRLGDKVATGTAYRKLKRLYRVKKKRSTR